MSDNDRVRRAKNLMMTNPDVIREMEHSASEIDRLAAAHVKQLCGVL